MSKGEAKQTNQKHRKYYDLVNTREFKLQTIQCIQELL